MGRHRHEFGFEFVELGELARHRGEARRQATKLVVPVGRDREAMAELSLGDCFHSRFQILDRAADRPREPHRDAGGQQRRERQDRR